MEKELAKNNLPPISIKSIPWNKGKSECTVTVFGEKIKIDGNSIMRGIVLVVVKNTSILIKRIFDTWNSQNDLNMLKEILRLLEIEDENITVAVGMSDEMSKLLDEEFYTLFESKFKIGFRESFALIYNKLMKNPIEMHNFNKPVEISCGMKTIKVLSVGYNQIKEYGPAKVYFCNKEITIDRNYEFIRGVVLVVFKKENILMKRVFDTWGKESEAVLLKEYLELIPFQDEDVYVVLAASDEMTRYLGDEIYTFIENNFKSKIVRKVKFREAFALIYNKNIETIEEIGNNSVVNLQINVR